MDFIYPLNDLIGPSMVLGAVAGAVAAAFAACLYRGYLTRQQEAWANR